MHEDASRAPVVTLMEHLPWVFFFPHSFVDVFLGLSVGLVDAGYPRVRAVYTVHITCDSGDIMSIPVIEWRVSSHPAKASSS